MYKSSRQEFYWNKVNYNNVIITISQHIRNPGILMPEAFSKRCQISKIMMMHIKNPGIVRTGFSFPFLRIEKNADIGKKALIVSPFELNFPFKMKLCSYVAFYLRFKQNVY